jgi:hypothetical protein
MLAPPNRGSELADLLHRQPIYRRALGPAAIQLVTHRDDALETLLGTVDFELGVIAGDRPFASLGAMLLPRPNDGRVSVAATRDAGAADHLVVPANHVSILWDREAIRQALAFLRDGRFDRSTQAGEAAAR